MIAEQSSYSASYPHNPMIVKNCGQKPLQVVSNNNVVSILQSDQSLEDRLITEGQRKLLEKRQRIKDESNPFKKQITAVMARCEEQYKQMPAQKHEGKATIPVTPVASEEKVKGKHKISGKQSSLSNSDKVRYYEKEQSIARWDRGLGLMDLFLHRKKGSQRKHRDDIPSQKFNGFEISVEGPEMGEKEQTLVLWLMMLARKKNAEKNIKTTEKGDSYAIRTVRTCPIRTDITELYRLLGLKKSGQNQKLIEDLLIKVKAVTVKIKSLDSSKKTVITSLISGDIGIGPEGINVTLNHLLTEALMASAQKGGGGYAAINMIDHMSLPKGPIRLLHTRLCVWGGQSKDISNVGLETLILRVFGFVADKRINRQEYSDQRKTIIRGLKLIAGFKSFQGKLMPLGITSGDIFPTESDNNPTECDMSPTKSDI
jgi:hypothetical protein